MSLTLQVADPDGDSVGFYPVQDLPPGLSFDPQTRVISGTVEYSAASAYTPTARYPITVQAYDGSHMATMTFDWDVTNVNRRPMITNYGTADEWKFVEGQSVNLPIQAHDPDGDQITYTALNLPPGLSIDEYGYVTGTVGAHGDTNPTKEYPVQIKVSDGGLWSDPVSPFCQVTDFRIDTATIYAPPGWDGQVTTNQTTFTVILTGVGARNANFGGTQFYYRVLGLDPATGELQTLQEIVTITANGTGPTGTWTRSITFNLHSTTTGRVSGTDGNVGFAGTTRGYLRFYRAMTGTHFARAGGFEVTPNP